MEDDPCQLTVADEATAHDPFREVFFMDSLFFKLVKFDPYKDQINLSTKFMVFGMDSDKEFSEEQFTQF